jgi:murein DD-endopeptidase MepM/ murein hydrolase activator NlpD
MPRTAILLAILLLAGCAPAVPAPASLPTNAPATVTNLPPTPTPVLSPSPAEVASPSAAPTLAEPPAPSATQPAPQVCSPLQDIPLDQMSAIVSNPYHPPRAGSDDPHHGVDLADRLPNGQVAVAGRAVQAVLAGRVAAVIRDRFPYGSAVLVETALGELPAGWENQGLLPSAAPTLAQTSPLTCPAMPLPFPGSTGRSLYLLYAHLQQPTTLQVEEAVGCGQTIGAVGDSGNALNPHLHFEARVGPTGLRLPGMAHYDPSASLEEMSSYCLWRISGWFQLVDPLQVLLTGLE